MSILRNLFFLLILQGLFLSSCGAQEYFKKGDRVLYYFDFGPTIQTNDYSNLSEQIKRYELPQMIKSTTGIQLSAAMYSGKRLVLGTSFLEYEVEDSTNYTKLKQRNFEWNAYVGYNVFKARIYERFGLIPQVGLFMQRTTLLYSRSAEDLINTNIDNINYLFKEGKNKIIRNTYGAFTSLRINYSTRTGSMLDLFSFGIEPGVKYVLTPDKKSYIKNRKLFYNSPENMIAPFLTFHFKVPVASWVNHKSLRP